jgi:hypothetical protein
MYLSRALDEFHRASNPLDLWVPVDALHRGSILEKPQALMTAQNRRIHFLRSSVLFAAISAEALANELLTDLLSSGDAEALDSLTMPEKFLMGTRIGAGKELVDRGRYPMGALLTLAETRNRLVHPRPSGGIAAWTQDVEEADEKAIGPRAAEKAILAVADVAVLCNPLRPHPVLHDGIAKTIAANREMLATYRKTCGDGLRDVPAENSPSTPTLMDQIREPLAERLAPSAAGSESDL